MFYIATSLKSSSCKCVARINHVIASSFSQDSTSVLKAEYDAVVIGAGHNGLVSAAYLAKSGLRTAVFERRHVIGGAAVTEEMIPGYKFSRASYVLSLLRPQIYKDLELKKHGLKVYVRDPNSYTPVRGSNKSLLMGNDARKNYQSIAQFSVQDAKMYCAFEKHLEKLVSAIEPLLDSQPVNCAKLNSFSIKDKITSVPSLRALVKVGMVGKDFPRLYELITAPASKILDKWFDSEPLKATLASDAVIGAMTSPYFNGSGYVLLHHVMGETEGIKGAWGNPEGGMGAVSNAIAKSARSHGASIFTEKPVAKLVVNSNKKVTGIMLEDGTHVKAKAVLCNPTPRVTYLDLLEKNVLPEEYRKEVDAIDYTSPVTKINVAVNKLPNFTADPNGLDSKPLPHHGCTIHLNSESMAMIHEAYNQAQQGDIPHRPLIEMTIPSSLDPTIAPAGHHVCLLFTQYTPYHLKDGQTWDEKTKKVYADRVFSCIEEYAPGFTDSIVGYDHLSPPDLEKIFGLTGGNIFHGSMSLDQLYFGRPTSSYSDTRCPVEGMYLCGSGAHPGGGVMGSPGKLAAEAALYDLKKGCLR